MNEPKNVAGSDNSTAGTARAGDADLRQKGLSKEPIESLMHGVSSIVEQISRVADEVEKLGKYIRYLGYLEYLPYLENLKIQRLAEPVPEDAISDVTTPLQAPMWNKEGREPFPPDGQGFEDLPEENQAAAKPAAG